jgi:hypothetical protein
MTRKIFKKVGLRRDNNLGDLSNSTEALNNLIDGLVDNISVDTFISEDLDCIRGIYSAGLDNAGYSQIIGSAVEFTDSSGSNVDFFPRITYQNRLDRFKIFAGNPRFNGGNGLTASYFNTNQVFENSVGIFSGIPFKTDNFWENGNFQYSGKLTPESVDVNGGVKWEGYFIPTQTATHSFYINSSACFTFDFESQGYISDPTGTIIAFSRYYSTSLGGFNFYTSNPSLEDLTGYNLQNTEAFFAYTTQVSNTTPLYRAHSSSGPHLYTTNKNEYDNLPSNIWTKENIVGYVYASVPGTITNQPVYRAYNSTTGDFLLTTSLTEATTSSGYTNQPSSVFYAPYPSYTEISRIGLTTSLSASGTLNSNQITLTTASNAKYVGVGQSISGVGINTGTVVASVDRSTGVVGLTPPSGNAVTATFTNENKTFFKTIGQDTLISHSTYILNAQQRYRFRARYYIPSSVDAITAQRNIQFNYSDPTSGVVDLRYNVLYSYDYDFSDAVKGEFLNFIDNSIRFGGGTLGGVLSNNYVKVKSSKKVDIKYQPKTTLANITKNTITGTTVINTNIINLLNTTNLEVGNYVFGTGIPENTRIDQILINGGVTIDTLATASGSTSLTFIDHRGFVKRIQGSASTTTFTLSSGDTTDLKSGMILIGPGASAYTGITTTSSTSTFTIAPSQTLGASTYYVYQSRGLINESLNAFCNRTITKCLVVAAPGADIGSTTIPVISNEGVTNQSSVQGFYFATGTRIVNSTATSITIDIATTRALVAGANFTVTSDSGDRQLCCPPTDTSPPFTATLDGLDTVSDSPSLRIESGNVIFDELTAVVSPLNITPLLPDSSSYTSTSRLSIKTPIGTYKILCA